MAVGHPTETYEFNRQIERVEEALDRGTYQGAADARMHWDRLVAMIDTGGFIEEVESIEVMRVARLAHAMHYGSIMHPMPETVTAFIEWPR